MSEKPLNMSTSSENEAPSKDSEGPSKDERPPSIVYGPATPVPLKMTFAELLDYNAEVRGDRPAVISDPQNLTLSFRQLRERSIDWLGQWQTMVLGEATWTQSRSAAGSSISRRISLAPDLVLLLLNYAYTESEMLAVLKVVRKYRL
ncbi:hypothetical protein TI39_contig5827g00003 [Zymoseptoria brevis]|uniref:Uncharacterized protein n=1 Tax=Zymoseptoria brevis TaxID=1047168 RepID=A0A0F4G5Z1_9PEZI|nr:hypothetical protein TI39_contig5827g00003 [Zymoseptoria brevis]